MAGKPKFRVSEEDWSHGDVSCPDCKGSLSDSREGEAHRACESCGHAFSRIDGTIKRRLTDEERDWVANNIGIAHNMALQMTGIGRPISLEEGRDAAFDGLVNAARTYDESKGANRATHARHTVKFYIESRRKEIAWIRPKDNFSRICRFSEISKDVRNYYNHSGNKIVYYDTIDRKTIEEHDPEGDYSELYAAIERLPDERMKSVVLARMRGVKLAALGRMMNISKERVRQLESKAHDIILCILSGKEPPAPIPNNPVRVSGPRTARKHSAS